MRAKFSLFGIEIALVLITKLVLLVCLKLVFFNDPVTPHLSGKDVDRLFLGQAPTDDTSPSFKESR